ncbi:polysaccharide ABC transporter ATP-binding protein [Ferrigenium kumadai]|nr:ABC transporter ATP-binding protein [Ferrigenium kumadai]
MHSDIAISVRNLTKNYRIFGHPTDRIKQALTLGRMHFHREFTALQDVSFDIQKGETVGIIGRNGSGKSTLLQLICGILKPSCGSVEVNGRISALLELGAGFNPEFTGRENVYFQGALMGISKDEMDERFDEIASFADIGEFIDQPVRTYSSGMFVRLAFAVSIRVDPEILIVDEALSVGDMEFQAKSFQAMRKMQEDGLSIFLVTHSLPLVRNFCQRAIWLDHGKLIKAGPASEICREYASHTQAAPESIRSQIKSAAEMAVFEPNKTTGISIKQVSLDKQSLYVGDNLSISVSLTFFKEVNASEFGVGIIVYHDDGRLCTLFNTIRDNVIPEVPDDCIKLEIPKISFIPGHYLVSVNVCDYAGVFSFDKLDHCAAFEVMEEFNLNGIPRWEGEIACEHRWTK